MLLQKYVTNILQTITNIFQTSQRSALHTIKPELRTIKIKEIEYYTIHANEWWQQNSQFRPLLEYNRIRLPFIEKQVHKVLGTSLSSCRVLDVGCGGGYLSEALASTGAQVVGIDATGNLLKIAENHRQYQIEHNQESPFIANAFKQLKYIEADIGTFASEDNVNTFDVVVASEVIEHVDNIPLFLQKCTSLVKPGGVMIITTPNRNILSFMIVIIAAEYIFKLLPKGTHHYNQFIRPKELISLVQDNNEIGNNMMKIDYKGTCYFPWPFNFWMTEPFGLLSYMIGFKKLKKKMN